MRKKKKISLAKQGDKNAPIIGNIAQTDKKTNIADEKQRFVNFRSLAKHWLQIPVWLVNIVVPSTISILLGFSPSPQDIPLFNLIKQHAVGSLLIGGILALITIIALITSHTKEGSEATNRHLYQKRSWLARGWITATILSTFSFILSSSFLTLVLIRPHWCPLALCPPPQVITRGVHDANLDVYVIAIQSSAFVLSEPPESYSSGNLPKQISAMYLDGKASPSPYRIVLGTHSLQQGQFGVLIEQMDIVIKHVAPIPRPLNVWMPGSSLTYNTNPYQVFYNSQHAGDTLTAIYMPVPYAHVQLAPGEADQLNIQVGSQSLAAVRFQVQATYRITNESQRHTILLPDIFEVIFSDASNWHEYRLQNGRFVKQ